MTRFRHETDAGPALGWGAVHSLVNPS